MADAECASGLCAANVCTTGPTPGPALHWKFNEAMGSSALDASGNARNGTYLGATASTTVPTAGSPGNPFSRSFVRDNATRNAGDMINNLTLVYNRTRQAAITGELIEIISAKEAM
jgi:hypothetical protein